jgi:hypothetical protein
LPPKSFPARTTFFNKSCTTAAAIQSRPHFGVPFILLPIGGVVKLPSLQPADPLGGVNCRPPTVIITLPAATPVLLLLRSCNGKPIVVPPIRRGGHSWKFLLPLLAVQSVQIC